MASRPDQALSWGQAGGSLRADSAGVWWCSMTYRERTQYMSFVENQAYIESGWDSTFGDRKNEIVFIGQDMEEQQIVADLDACLSNEDELKTKKWESGYSDEWPVQRMHD